MLIQLVAHNSVAIVLSLLLVTLNWSGKLIHEANQSNDKLRESIDKSENQSDRFKIYIPDWTKRKIIPNKKNKINLNI